MAENEDLKNKAKEIIDAALEQSDAAGNAMGDAVNKFIDDNAANIDSAAEKVEGFFDAAAGVAAGAAEKITNEDLDGDGKIAGKDADPNAKSLFDTLKDKAEEVTGKDLDGDGAVGGGEQ